MDAIRQERLGELFEQLVSRAPADRAEFLDSSCKGDPGLRAELDSLLTSFEEAPDFLEGLPGKVAARAFVSLSAPLEEIAQDHIGDRYEIIERLGGGGMGEVYKARDRRLGRLVALKLLPPHLNSDDLARNRLFSEARAAASVLDHPNIAIVHEIDETEGGDLFISMAYYEGGTLQERLARGVLPMGEAFEVGRQIASGLAAAHRAGIVHRDIKPSNVLITPANIVKLVDFGIAKAAGADLTREGAILGTAAYMSPEQTRGETTDPRTDVWSFGAVFYEMVAGERPFRAEEADSLIYAIRHDEPEPVEGLRPDVPAALAGMIATCLKKDPADRYRNIDLLLAELEELQRDPEAPWKPKKSRQRAIVPAGTIAVLVLAGGLFYTRGPWGAHEKSQTAYVAAATQRLAVLPLVGYGLDSEDAYLAEALTEEISVRLSKLSDLRVIAHSSIMKYQESDKSPAEIARELEVEAILEGSVRKAGDRIRLMVQLVDPRSQEPLWTDDYSVEGVDVLAIQSEIAEHVAEALHLQMQSGERRRLARQETENPRAYTEYLKGRYFLDKWDEQSARQALMHFRQSLDLEPTYARAWGGLADTYGVLAGLSALPADEAYPRARAAAEKALDLDEEQAEAHSALGMALSYYYWDPQGAEGHFRRAVDLDPNDARTRALYAEHHRNQGRFPEALAEIEVAQGLDPLSYDHELEEGIILYLARRYDDSIQHYQRLLDVNADRRYTYFFIALAMTQQKRYQEALAALEELDPQRKSPDARGLRGYIYAVTDRPAEARATLASLNQPPQNPGRTGFPRAVIQIGLGENGRAVDSLWEAFRERAWQVRLMKVEPLLDPVRSDPRFQSLLEEVGLGSDVSRS
jgi:serine/threonine-protein kinase